MITAGVASVLQSTRTVYVGLAIVVMGFVVWGFACGTAIVWAALATIRETGFRPFVKDCASTPTVAVIVIMEMLLYCMFGFGGVLLILKMTAFMK
jgi:hypothetical protein